MKKSNKKGLKLSTVKRLWSEINDKVFDGELSEPVLRITRANRYFGKCSVVDSSKSAKITIMVSGRMHRDTCHALIDTLAHEMIHQWQYENGYRYNDNHDETFTQWLPIVKEKLGIDLYESWNESFG